MVSAKTIIFIGLIGVFLLAGGSKLVKPTIDTLSVGFTKAKTVLEEQSRNIKNKTEGGKVG